MNYINYRLHEINEELEFLNKNHGNIQDIKRLEKERLYLLSHIDYIGG